MVAKAASSSAKKQQAQMEDSRQQRSRSVGSEPREKVSASLAQKAIAKATAKGDLVPKAAPASAKKTIAKKAKEGGPRAATPMLFDVDENESGEVDYASQEYWNKRYDSGKDLDKEFEWFLSYADIEPVLRSVIPFNDRTAIFIDLGCGTSMFLRDLKRAGFMGALLGVDYSTKAVEAMRKRDDCAGINFKNCDAREMDDVVKGATAVLDKSLMDTMLHSHDNKLVPDLLQAVARSIRPDGKFISITQMDPRKPEDLKFLQEVVLKNLRSTYQSVAKVTVHLSDSPEGDSRPVPSVFVYHFGAGSGKDDIEMEIVEYESSDDGSATNDE